MAQFDVFINPSSTTRKAFPYIVDIGSLNHFRDEIVAALDFAITGF